MGSLFVQFAFEMVDAAWIGRLPHAQDQVAALTIGAYVIWLTLCLFQLVSVGISTVVAQLVGARQRPRGAKAARQALVLGLVIAPLAGLVGWLTLEPLVAWMDVEPGVAAPLREYLTVFYLGAFFSYGVMVMDGVLRGAGDALTPLKVAGAACALNAVLDPILIFGVGDLPGLGVMGAGVASVASKAAACLFYVALASRGRFFFWTGRTDRTGRESWNWPLVGRTLVLGLPIALMGVAFMLVYLQLSREAGQFGSAVISAMGLGNRIEMISYVAAEGFAMAAQAVVGQHVGAGDLLRARRAAWLAVGLGAGVTGFVGVLMVLVPETLGRLFTNEPVVLAEIVRYCHVIGPFQVFMAFEVVLSGAFSGAGRTVPPMVISIPWTAARIPLVWWFTGPLGWGVSGIWIAIALTQVARGVWSLLWFGWGAWHRRIPEAEAAAGG